MQPGPQILVKFKNGEKVVFEVPGHEEFVSLVNQVSRLWSSWLFIGPNAAVRKKDVEALYYLKDGWNTHSSEMNIPKD